MTGKPLGPFDAEAQARAAAVAVAEPGSSPVKPAKNRRLLGRVCQAAGVAMGRYDDRIVEWLSVWEPSTVAVVAGWISRAYEAGLTRTPDGDVMLSSAEADTVRQALADAVAWQSMRAGGFPTGCGDCAALDPERCPDHARDEVIAEAYAALRARLGGDQS
jgi:hypothetical protein